MSDLVCINLRDPDFFKMLQNLGAISKTKQSGGFRNQKGGADRYNAVAWVIMAALTGAAVVGTLYAMGAFTAVVVPAVCTTVGTVDSEIINQATHSVLTEGHRVPGIIQTCTEGRTIEVWENIVNTIQETLQHDNDYMMLFTVSAPLVLSKVNEKIANILRKKFKKETIKLLNANVVSEKECTELLNQEYNDWDIWKNDREKWVQNQKDDFFKTLPRRKRYFGLKSESDEDFSKRAKKEFKEYLNDKKAEYENRDNKIELCSENKCKQLLDEDKADYEYKLWKKKEDGQYFKFKKDEFIKKWKSSNVKRRSWWGTRESDQEYEERANQAWINNLEDEMLQGEKRNTDIDNQAALCMSKIMKRRLSGLEDEESNEAESKLLEMPFPQTSEEYSLPSLPNIDEQVLVGSEAAHYTVEQSRPAVIPEDTENKELLLRQAAKRLAQATKEMVPPETVKLPKVPNIEEIEASYEQDRREKLKKTASTIADATRKMATAETYTPIKLPEEAKYEKYDRRREDILRSAKTMAEATRDMVSSIEEDELNAALQRYEQGKRKKSLLIFDWDQTLCAIHTIMEQKPSRKDIFDKQFLPEMRKYPENYFNEFKEMKKLFDELTKRKYVLAIASFGYKPKVLQMIRNSYGENLFHAKNIVCTNEFASQPERYEKTTNDEDYYMPAENPEECDIEQQYKKKVCKNHLIKLLMEQNKVDANHTYFFDDSKHNVEQAKKISDIVAVYVPVDAEKRGTLTPNVVIEALLPKLEKNEREDLLLKLEKNEHKDLLSKLEKNERKDLQSKLEKDELDYLTAKTYSEYKSLLREEEKNAQHEKEMEDMKQEIAEEAEKHRQESLLKKQKWAKENEEYIRQSELKNKQWQKEYNAQRRSEDLALLQAEKKIRVQAEERARIQAEKDKQIQAEQKARLRAQEIERQESIKKLIKTAEKKSLERKLQREADEERLSELRKQREEREKKEREEREQKIPRDEATEQRLRRAREQQTRVAELVKNYEKKKNARLAAEVSPRIDNRLPEEYADLADIVSPLIDKTLPEDYEGGKRQKKRTQKSHKKHKSNMKRRQHKHKKRRTNT